MTSNAARRIEFAPPPPARWGGPLGKAAAVHALLIAALTWGVSWRHDADTPAVEAELWSRLPQQGAPRAVEPPPPPPAPAPAQPDIATQQAKARAEAEAREREREREQQRRLAEQREREAAQKKAAAEKAAAEKKAQAERERQQRLAEQKREAERKAAEERRQAQIQEQLRKEQLARVMGQAGASGGPQSTGTAQQSSGPSASYAGKVVARIKPNVVFTELAPGNPRAEVEVRVAPDGTITGRKLVKSSGNPAWDEAVLRAIDRTATLPRDVDGRVPSSMLIGLRPLD